MTEFELFKMLEPNEYTLWTFIRFLREKNGMGNYIPNYDKISDGLDISRRQSMRIIKQLKDKGLI